MLYPTLIVYPPWYLVTVSQRLYSLSAWVTVRVFTSHACTIMPGWLALVGGSKHLTPCPSLQVLDALSTLTGSRGFARLELLLFFLTWSHYCEYILYQMSSFPCAYLNHKSPLLWSSSEAEQMYIANSVLQRLPPTSFLKLFSLQSMKTIHFITSFNLLFFFLYSGQQGWFIEVSLKTKGALQTHWASGPSHSNHTHYSKKTYITGNICLSSPCLTRYLSLITIRASIPVPSWIIHKLWSFGLVVYPENFWSVE